ncbi:MAG: O-antigen ligase family protein [Bacteroidota bacterium]
MIALLIIAILDARFTPFNFSLSESLKSLKNFPKQFDFAAILLFFIIIVYTGIYSSNMDYFGIKLVLRFPFVMLPIAFFLIPKFSKAQYYGIFTFLSMLLLFQNLIIGIQYLLDPAFYIEAIGKGKALPTPISHIRYSLLLAMTCFTSFYLWKEQFIFRYKWEKYIQIGLAIAHFTFLHFLAVRSGLLAFYGTLFILVILGMFIKKVYRKGFVLMILMGALLVMAVHNIPSLQKKWQYMKYDFEQFQAGKGGNYSDMDRIKSLKYAFGIIKEKPLIGVGAGDMIDEIKSASDQTISKLPHNQFVTTTLAGGIIALLLFLMAFFTPIVFNKNYRSTFLIILCAIIGFSFLTEDTFESAVGIAIYTFFICLILNQLKPS